MGALKMDMCQIFSIMCRLIVRAKKNDGMIALDPRTAPQCRHPESNECPSRAGESVLRSPGLKPFDFSAHRRQDRKWLYCMNPMNQVENLTMSSSRRQAKGFTSSWPDSSGVRLSSGGSDLPRAAHTRALFGR
jgi:hypothetical protein